MLVELPILWIVLLNVLAWLVIQLGLAWMMIRKISSHQALERSLA